MAEVQYAAVLTEIVELVSRWCHRPVSEETRFAADLSLDSIGTMDLVAEMEDHFGLMIPVEEAREMETVGDAARFLTGLLVAEGSARSGSGA